MSTFYDEWLSAGERIQEEFRKSPMIARDDEGWHRPRCQRLYVLAEYASAAGNFKEYGQRTRGFRRCCRWQSEESQA
jgi:hypothetical protein